MAKRSIQSGDTSLNLGDSDTDTLELFVVGRPVRVAAGPLEGVVGTVKEIRDRSHVLLQLEHGVYVVVAKFMVRSLGSP